MNEFLQYFCSFSQLLGNFLERCVRIPTAAQLPPIILTQFLTAHDEPVGSSSYACCLWTGSVGANMDRDTDYSDPVSSFSSDFPYKRCVSALKSTTTIYLHNFQTLIDYHAAVRVAISVMNWTTRQPLKHLLHFLLHKTKMFFDEGTSTKSNVSLRSM